jgi:hypothetical protein
VTQIMGRGGCRHVKERHEPFTQLTVEVKDHATLEASLRAYTQGEPLDGDNQYLCGVCGHKVDADKRAALGALPDCLVVNLKRFDLDYETFQKVKLNTELRFQPTLDMYPFTTSGLLEHAAEAAAAAAGGGAPDGGAVAAAAASASASDGQQPDGPSGSSSSSSSSSDSEAAPPAGGHIIVSDAPDGSPVPPLRPTRAECQYELTGVLVHSGNATGGHYFSFIAPRPGDDDPAGGSGVLLLCREYARLCAVAGALAHDEAAAAAGAAAGTAAALEPPAAHPAPGGEAHARDAAALPGLHEDAAGASNEGEDVHMRGVAASVSVPPSSSAAWRPTPPAQGAPATRLPSLA